MRARVLTIGRTVLTQNGQRRCLTVVGAQGGAFDTEAGQDQQGAFIEGKFLAKRDSKLGVVHQNA